MSVPRGEESAGEAHEHLDAVTDPLHGNPPGGGAVEAVELAADEPAVGLSRLYSARHDDMVRLAYLITGSSETAADVTQDSFVKLFRKWDTVREPEAYLRRIVVNGCRSSHRRRRRERDRAREQAAVVQAADLEADELSDALAKLPHRQRAAIVLRYYDGCSEAEIAQVLGCRPGTVGSLVHRGLAALREVIEP